MQFTPEQLRAITTHDRNLIVTAGAGSGKTSVLVERFIHLLDANREWALMEIVAITFTEKAAREMRERIREAIRAKVNQSQGELEYRHWKTHENNLDSARISTIHGLCTRILRANPVEARLDPRFEVLDDVNATTLQDEVIERTLAQVVDEDRPAASLLPYYEVRTVRSVLKNFISTGWIDDFLQDELNKPSLLASWAKLWASVNQDTLLQVRSHRDFLGAFGALGELPPGDKLALICEDVLACEIPILEGSLETVIDTLNTLTRVIKLNVGSASNWGGKEALAEIKETLKFLRSTAAELLEGFYPTLSAIDDQAAELNLQWRDLINLLRQNYQLAKNDRQALDFDDLEQRTCQLLQQHPSVAERYAHPTDGEFRHVMVDEFQDTNDAQRQIIYGLCGITGNRADLAPPGKLFVVGDPKQSIYAFRGADVSVFQEVRSDILARGGEPVSLNLSFRAHERLVRTFNELFANVMTPESGLAQAYSVTFDEPMIANRVSTSTHEFPLHVITLETPDKDQHGTLETDKFRQWEANEIATTISQMVDAGTLIYSKQARDYRPMNFGDVAILFRAMTNVALYEEVFQARGVPYLTVAGKGYFDQQEIWDLRNLLKAIHNPADDLALASALRSPLFSFSDDLLLALRLRSTDENHRKPLPLWQAIFWEGEIPAHWPPLPADEHSKVTFVWDILRVLRGLAGRITIAELLTQALDLTGFETTLISLPNGERRRANILKFLEVARTSQRVSLGAFNAYVEDMVAAEAREGEATLEPDGTVTFMTVHKSKGLEFPVVVLADASYNNSFRGDVVMMTREYGLACKVEGEDEDPVPFIYALTKNFNKQREASENKRLLYVGATRAQDYLIVSGKSASKGENWLKQIREALNLTLYGPSNCGEITPDIYLHVADTPLMHHRSQRRTTEPMPTPSIDIEPIEATLITPPQVPLLASIPPQMPPIRHISASNLELLGRVFDSKSKIGVSDFKRRVLRGAPDPVRPLIDTHDPTKIPAYVVGNIVHRALRVQAIEQALSEDYIRNILRGYAWEEGLTHDIAIQTAVSEAESLLTTYANSEIRHQIANAQNVYKEIEFALRRGDYLIHGIIDLLFSRQEHGKVQWVVVDYKSDKIFRKWEEESQQYVYQLGAYAAAVEEKTGLAPRVYLYYLRSNRLWEIKEEVWRTALDGLSFQLTRILSE